MTAAIVLSSSVLTVLLATIEIQCHVTCFDDQDGG